MADCFSWGIGVPHLAAAGVAGFVVAPFLGPRAALCMWALGAVAAYAGLRESTQGELLFSDDHPAFLYRLSQLKAHFPHVPFYNPMWNGGVEAREFFPSGVLNVFFLLAPLLAFVDPVERYNELVSVLFFVVYPACTYFATRILRIHAPFAPVLALLPCTLWFRYEFSYGTLGFLTAIALAPLCYALLTRIADEGTGVSWKILGSFVVVGSLVALWTPAIFVLAPAVLILVAPLARFAVTKKGGMTLLALLMLNVPWVLIFLEASRVASFMTVAQSGEAEAIVYPGLRTLLDDARYVWKGAAPAILVLTIPGLVLLRREHTLACRVFGFSIVVLFAVGLFLSPFKPRLELGRLMLVSVYLSVIPAAAVLSRVPISGLPRIAGGVALGSVLLVPATVYVFTAHRTLERFSPYSPELPGLVAAIKEYADGGRIAFSGYTQHELDGGHVTPLPMFTGVPLYASRYQHDRWEHADFIPVQFRKHHDAGIETFFDLFNITGVAVHDPEWKPWFAARPEFYERVWEGRVFDLYRRRFGPKSWFVEGGGEVLQQDLAEIRLRPDTPTVVIRFNWLPFLEVDGCEKLSPAEVYEGITFIRLDGCEPRAEATIRARSAFSRIFGG